MRSTSDILDDDALEAAQSLSPIVEGAEEASATPPSAQNPENREQGVFDAVRNELAPVLADAVRSLVEAHDDDAATEWAAAATYIDRVTTPIETPHPDSVLSPVDSNPTVEGQQRGFATGPVETPPPQLTRSPRGSHELVPGGPRLLRDRFALLEIARYRVMSFRQLQTQVFGSLHKAVLTRRMQALKRDGFIETWEDRLVIGGHPSYAVPTKKGLSWALDELKAEAKGTPHEKLLGVMIGEAAKRPLVLAPRSAPPFLPHQDETNRVVAALEAIPELGITWASTWHRPFPNEVDDIALPQPDAVLVATRDGTPHLVFLEHDRGQEAPASFARKKAERFSELALYGLTAELFGFQDFTVWVTVNDVANGKPLQRIRTLQAVSRSASMMRFTLAGWIPAYAHTRRIWFSVFETATGNERRPDAHLLVEPFPPRDASVYDQSAADLLRRMRAAHAQQASTSSFIP